MRRAVQASVGLVLLLVGRAAAAGTPAGVEAAAEESRTLLREGKKKQAVDALKQARLRWPDSEYLTTELANAYVADNNHFWALRVLQQYEDSHPPACASRFWMVWIHLRQANLDLALELLDRPGCNRSEERARTSLLRARIAQLQSAPEMAKESLAQARDSSTLFEEDVALRGKLSAELEPGRLPWAWWRGDIGVGWTTNGLAGSPVDQSALAGATGSAIVLAEARARFLWPIRPAFRPVLEGGFRTQQLFAEAAQPLSYVLPSLRPGILLGSQPSRLLLAYSFDAVRLSVKDKYEGEPVWFAEGHRAEYEFEATEALVVFGGAGRRVFRDLGRTRMEADQGLAFVLPLSKQLRWMLGGSARWHVAHRDAFNLFGGSLITQLQVALPKHFEARGTASLSRDVYPRSLGHFGEPQGTARKDTFAKAKVGFWTPSLEGLRIGVDYEYAQRDSTAEPYSFTDHRTLLHLAWTSDSDKAGTSTVDSAGRSALDYELGIRSTLADDTRIRDLMRQDETTKQNSSCLK